MFEKGVKVDWKLVIATLFILVIFCFFVRPTFADEVMKEKDWVKGAVVTGVSNSGSCLFKPFIKVGITEDTDDGKAQILGYEPGNVQISRKGKIIFERAHEALFVELGKWKSVRGRVCKCPPYSNL